MYSFFVIVAMISAVVGVVCVVRGSLAGGFVAALFLMVGLVGVAVMQMHWDHCAGMPFVTKWCG